MGNKTSFRPIIPLKVKNKIIDDLSNGVNRKLIADTYSVSQTFITDCKQEMPLFSYCWKQ